MKKQMVTGFLMVLASMVATGCSDRPKTALGPLTAPLGAANASPTPLAPEQLATQRAQQECLSQSGYLTLNDCMDVEGYGCSSQNISGVAEAEPEPFVVGIACFFRP